MKNQDRLTFQSEIRIIDINPYVSVPNEILLVLFAQAGKSKSPIPIVGNINNFSFTQTLVKFRGEWRLYLNTPMRSNTGTKIGDVVTFEISFDRRKREHKIHPELQDAMNKNQQAKDVFESLRPSLQKEIIRYINHLKTEDSVTKNVDNAIQFLIGNRRFVGRDKP